MDLLQVLAALDRKKAALEAYIPRIRAAGWIFPPVARRFVRETNARIKAVDEEREKVLRQIQADPHAYRRLKELFEAKDKPPALPVHMLRGFSPSEELKVLGHRVVDWEAAEGEAERQFLDGLDYYASGAWRKDNINSEAVDAFVNGLRNERDNTRMSRGAALDAFQRQLEREHAIGLGPVSLQREVLLAEYRKTALAPSPRDALERFVESQKRPRIKGPVASERER